MHSPEQQDRPLYRLEAEMSVVGSLMLDPRAFERIEGIVNAEDFYGLQNRILMEVLVDLWAGNMQIDTPTLLHELQTRDQLAAAGGAQYLLELEMWAITSANIEYHARVVREMSQRRQLVAIAQDMAFLAKSDKKLEVILDSSERMVRACSSRSTSDALRRIDGELILGTVEKKATGDLGVMTGFHALDNITLGFLPGELWILAGGTSMGKTAFALQAAQHVAETAGPVAIFTLEMMKEELIWRMLCAEACIDGQEYRRRKGKIGEQGEEALALAAAHLNTLPIFLDETSLVTTNHVRANARRMAATAGLSLIVVDHLQIMEETDGENRNLALASMTRGLKALAKDLRVPVVVLSQLSRFKDRADKRPQLSDLRESGAIDQDANGVIMLFRPEYYYGPTDKDGNSIKGKAEAIIGKSRNGATGSADLFFREEFARFENLTFRSQN